MTDDGLPTFIRRFAGEHPYAFSYGSAVLIPVGALGIVMILPYRQQQPVLLFFEAGIALATWAGGWKAGVVALIGGALACAYLTLENIYTPIVFRMVLNLVYSVGIIWVVAKLRSSQEALRKSEEKFRRLTPELEQRVAERTAQLETANQELLKEIADRKEIEEALRRSERYLAEAQRLTHTGSWAFRADAGDWVASYWSEENFRIWGFALQHGLPTTEMVRQRMHPEDRARALEHAQRALEAKIDYTSEFRVVLPDGSVRHILSLAHSDFGASGDYIELIGTDVDVTEHKQAEQERERLRQVEADLVHMNRISMLGELAVSLSHELKQPVAAIATTATACLTWLKRDKPNVEQACENARNIINDSNRAIQIINRLRSFYTKGAPAERQLVDVKEVLREMLAMLRSEAYRYKISMRIDIADEPPKVRADRVQLQQVLLNLMLNAIEAMRDTGGALTIKSELRPDDQLVISVSDTGVGLPAEKTNEIFNTFFTTKPQGSGMGLAITRSIVESHGGRLEAAAKDPHGAIFRFTLPTERGVGI